jgi:hypothetical protein
VGVGIACKHDRNGYVGARVAAERIINHVAHDLAGGA